MKLTIAVLGDGGGLARLGLERAGHTCTGFELDPTKHYLSQMVGSGNCILADMREVDLSGFDAVWASPPCQEHSEQNHGNRQQDNPYGSGELLEWCLNLSHNILWVENVINRESQRQPGPLYNAVQFLPKAIQKRRRFVAGRYKPPMVYRPFQWDYKTIDCCPAVLASEIGQGGMTRNSKNERRKASRWYGRPLTLDEMAYHQGFIIPDGWRKPLAGFTESQWQIELSQAIGNGVPVYMAQAFGAAYTGYYYDTSIMQLPLFAEIS